MDSIFTIIVVILMALAISDLVVGVSNDAVNFLNSAIGSKAAPRYIILTVASIGILIGSIFSSGMMEVARSGVFYPEMFTFADIMMLFLAVMLTDVILLDIFNTFGLPTSTTVSLIFELLGAAVAVSMVKILGSDSQTMADMSQYINSGNAMAIISGILISVVVAMTTGVTIMYISRLIFSFRYQKLFNAVGALWCGVALTAITYFAVFKGLEGTTLVSPETLDAISSNMLLLLGGLFVGWSIIMAFLQHIFKVNILKVTVLAGTFSLALAFAGNDLVNFIGVFMAGFDSYNIASATGDAAMMMGDLNKPVVANTLILLIAGLVMVLTLWFSKKSRTVTETEVNLARQDEGVERFGSTSVSRAIVRSAVRFNRRYEQYTPQRVQNFVASRFQPAEAIESKDKPSFDLIRASVNLMVASILISMATSLKLPLSTTYVTFMVAMGSSLADKAWGRESAVYRITGVLTVVSGWFLTAFIAFTAAFLVALGLMYTGGFGVFAFTALCIFILIRSNILHRKKAKRAADKEAEYNAENSTDIVKKCAREICETMKRVSEIYDNTLIGIFREDRKLLKQMMRESEELYDTARERKYEVLPTVQRLQAEDINTAHYYVQVADYMNEVTKSLVHITRPSFEHINNNHEGLSQEQIDDLMRINVKTSEIYSRVNQMLKSEDFSELDHTLLLRDSLFETFADAIKNQIKRSQNKDKNSNTRNSMLYFGIINESKTMILHSRNLLKSQKYFLSK